MVLFVFSFLLRRSWNLEQMWITQTPAHSGGRAAVIRVGSVCRRRWWMFETDASAERGKQDVCVGVCVVEERWLQWLNPKQTLAFCPGTNQIIVVAWGGSAGFLIGQWMTAGHFLQQRSRGVFFASAGFDPRKWCQTPDTVIPASSGPDTLPVHLNASPPQVYQPQRGSIRAAAVCRVMCSSLSLVSDYTPWCVCSVGPCSSLITYSKGTGVCSLLHVCVICRWAAHLSRRGHCELRKCKRNSLFRRVLI